jgi:hypothetical protein
MKSSQPTPLNPGQVRDSTEPGAIQVVDRGATCTGHLCELPELVVLVVTGRAAIIRGWSYCGS